MCENAAPEKISREELKALQQKIMDTIGETIGMKRLQQLVHTSSQTNIEYHLQNWHIHRQNQTRPGAGYFITVVENNIPPQEPEIKQYHTEKISQRDNFEQRQYTDEYLESFYYKPDIEEVEEAKT